MNSFDDSDDSGEFDSDLTAFDPKQHKDEQETLIKEVQERVYVKEGDTSVVCNVVKVTKDYDSPVTFRIRKDLEKKLNASVMIANKSKSLVINDILESGFEFLEMTNKKEGDLIINDYQKQLLLAWSQLPKNLGKSPSELLNSMIEQCLKNKVSL